MKPRVQVGTIARTSFFTVHSLAQNIELGGLIVCFNVKPSESRLHVTPSFVCECVVRAGYDANAFSLLLVFSRLSPHRIGSVMGDNNSSDGCLLLRGI